MKLNRSILLILIAFNINSYAQSMVGDTITIYIENKVELKLALEDFSKLKDSSTWVTMHLERFQKNLEYLKDIPNGLKSDEAEKLIYIPNEKITLEKIVKKEVFQLNENNVINTGFRDRAILKLDKITAYITTDDLGDISTIDLANSVTKMIDSLPRNTRRSTHQFFQFKNNQITLLHDKEIVGEGGDQLELTFDAGTSLIKNKFVGDIGFRLRVSLSKKGKIQSSAYTTLSLLYDFPSNRKTNINLFLNAGYDFYHDNKLSIGFQYGYLIRKEGDFFEDGTSRFGINIASESKLNLTPYIYVNKGFKSAYPGLRLGINF